jgi:hypothetical protein
MRSINAYNGCIGERKKRENTYDHNARMKTYGCSLDVEGVQYIEEKAKEKNINQLF